MTDSVPTYPFLSDEWIAATRALREEYRDRVRPGAIPKLKVNLVITDVPHGSGGIDAHLDTSGGEPEIDLGHLRDAEATVTADYGTTRKIFVDGNLGAAMEALQLGRITVQGDVMKLMSLAGLNADPTSMELGKKIRAITE